MPPCAAATVRCLAEGMGSGSPRWHRIRASAPWHLHRTKFPKPDRPPLAGLDIVLNAAGPYAATGAPLRKLCLEAGTSYTDINGEIADFQAALACGGEARSRKTAIIPGSGFGVVYGEALAIHAVKWLPAANWLRLSIAPASATHSPGALRSAAAVLAGGGYAISEGALRREVPARTSWHISWPGEAGKSRRYATVPRAELIAAQRSTDVSTIVTGAEMPLTAVLLLRLAGPLPGMILRSMAARKSAPQTSGNQDVAHLKSRIFAEAGSAEGLYQRP